MELQDHLFNKLNDAIAKGFTHHFHILQTGLIRCITTRKEYSVEVVSIEIESCVDCRSTFYLIVATDGTKGTAVEHWDF